MIQIKSWILVVELSDGRVVSLDVDSQCAGEIDAFLSDIESKGEINDYIVKGGELGKRTES